AAREAEPAEVSESELLERAMSAWRAGEVDAAAGWLERHRRAFPAPAYAAEAEALHTLVRCARNADPAAGARFLRAHPRHPFGALVRSACAP
ncbi:MAG: hypothetical protein AAGH15_18330, partial [Myxococcota bacterium]